MRTSLVLLLVLGACHGDSGGVTGGSAATATGSAAAATATAIAAQLPPSAAPTGWKVGDIVQVQRNDKFKYWYEAQIVIVGPTYKVLYTYDDTVEDGVAPSRVRKVDFVARTDVEAQVDGQWKPAKVVSHDPDGGYQISVGGGPATSFAPAQVRGLRKPKNVAHSSSSSSSSSSSANAPCPGPGLTRRCGGVCVNIQEDSNNCGSCGSRCRDGYRCDGHMSCRDASGNL